MDVYEVEVERKVVYAVAAEDEQAAREIAHQVADGALPAKMAMAVRGETRVVSSKPYGRRARTHEPPGSTPGGPMGEEGIVTRDDGSTLTQSSFR